jgi:hypothetical protein
MKSFALASALAAISVVSASPAGTKTLSDPPTKRGNLPAVSVSGNGKIFTDHVLMKIASFVDAFC